MIFFLPKTIYKFSFSQKPYDAIIKPPFQAIILVSDETENSLIHTALKMKMWEKCINVSDTCPCEAEMTPGQLAGCVNVTAPWI